MSKQQYHGRKAVIQFDNNKIASKLFLFHFGYNVTIPLTVISGVFSFRHCQETKAI